MACVVCLKNNVPMTPVQARIGTNQYFSDMLKEIAPFDPSGCLICRDCVAALIISYNFKTTYANSIAEHRRKGRKPLPPMVVLDSEDDEVAASPRPRRQQTTLTTVLRGINTKRKHRCNICCRHFKEERYLLKHQERHSDTKRPHLPCKKCGKQFLIAAHLKEHIC